MEGNSERAEMTTNNPDWITRQKQSCIDWFKFNICFCKAAAFASGLVFSYKLAEKAFVDVLITLFTDSKLSDEPKRHSLRFHIVYDLKYATAFVNSLEGLSAVMLIFLIYISEAFGGGHLKRSIFCLVVAYVCGLSILGFASSHELSKPYIDSLMIIIGLILVAVGRGGLLDFVEEFTDEQLEAHEPEPGRQSRNGEQSEAHEPEPGRQNRNGEQSEAHEPEPGRQNRNGEQPEPDQQNRNGEQSEAHELEPDRQSEKRVRARQKMWYLFASAAGSLVAIPIFMMQWNPRLFTIGGVMGTTCVLFCLATPLYHKKDQAAATSTRIAEEPFTSFTCIRVLWAALLKRREPYLMYNSQGRFFRLNNARCFPLHNGESELWPQAKSLSFHCYMERNLDFTSLCADYYMRETFIDAYSVPILLVGHPSSWVVQSDIAARVVLNPKTKRQSGRLMEGRHASSLERTTIQSCRRCGQPGHNSMRCSNPPMVNEGPSRIVPDEYRCKCSICHSVGYNKQTCPEKDSTVE